MVEIIQEMVTADATEPFAVFLIGMRINKPWKVHRWMPVGRAMGRMIQELQSESDSDLLHVESWFGPTTIMVQYWRSFEAQESYAKAIDKAHLPAWAEFNKRINSNGDVGIWHETYTISPGQFECVYNNMPAFGLARATQVVPATGHRNAARGRLQNDAGKYAA